MQLPRKVLGTASFAVLAAALGLQRICAVEHSWCVCGHEAHGPSSEWKHAVDFGWVALFVAANVLALKGQHPLRAWVYVTTLVLGILAPLGGAVLPRPIEWALALALVLAVGSSIAAVRPRGDAGGEA